MRDSNLTGRRTRFRVQLERGALADRCRGPEESGWQLDFDVAYAAGGIGLWFPFLVDRRANELRSKENVARSG